MRPADLLAAEPPRDCPICPRLVAYRLINQQQHPDWFNGPAPSFGDPMARLLIVGLALAGRAPTAPDGLSPATSPASCSTKHLISLAFRRARSRPARTTTCNLSTAWSPMPCVAPRRATSRRPPRRTTAGRFLTARIAALPRLKAIVTLGDVSRRNVLKALGLKASAGEPGHGSEFDAGPYRLFNSYHCSRLNTNTGRLTTAMFEALFARVRAYIDGP